jgi:hypothetical protein
MIGELRFMTDNILMKIKAQCKRKLLIGKWPLVVCMFIFAVAIINVAAQQFPELPRKDSRFTFARIYYDDTLTSIGRFRGPVGASSGPPWSHDWPRGEEHFMKIMAEITKLDVNPGGHITSFQTDDCFKYPIAYLCEVGYLDLSKEEAHRMAEYLLRGGFLIVDDFRGDSRTPDALGHFKNQMKQVFPDRSLEELPRTHQIWTCFYDISKVYIEPPYSRGLRPQYFGMSDDNGRLMMVVNYNNDISEYWEWSNDPSMPIDSSNEAYKYGVNYVMYALTH